MLAALFDPARSCGFRLVTTRGVVYTHSRHTVNMATSPSGKARVCKTLIVGSIPTVASDNAEAKLLRFCFPQQIAVKPVEATMRKKRSTKPSHGVKSTRFTRENKNALSMNRTLP